MLRKRCQLSTCLRLVVASEFQRFSSLKDFYPFRSWQMQNSELRLLRTIMAVKFDFLGRSRDTHRFKLSLFCQTLSKAVSPQDRGLVNTSLYRPYITQTRSKFVFTRTSRRLDKRVMVEMRMNGQHLSQDRSVRSCSWAELFGCCYLTVFCSFF